MGRVQPTSTHLGRKAAELEAWTVGCCSQVPVCCCCCRRCCCDCSRRDGQRGTQDRGALTRSPRNRAPSYPGSFLFFSSSCNYLTYIHIPYRKEHRTPRKPCFGFDLWGFADLHRVLPVLSGLFLPPTNEFKIQDSRFLPVNLRHRARACFALPGPHRDTESRRRKPGERIWTWKWSRTLRNPHRSRRQPRPLLLGVRGPSNTESPGGVTGLRCRASSAGRAKSDAIATSRAPAA